MSLEYRVVRSTMTWLWFIERREKEIGARLFGSWKSSWRDGWEALVVKSIPSGFENIRTVRSNVEGFAAFFTREDAEIVAKRLAVLDA